MNAILKTNVFHLAVLPGQSESCIDVSAVGTPSFQFFTLDLDGISNILHWDSQFNEYIFDYRLMSVLVSGFCCW